MTVIRELWSFAGLLVQLRLTNCEWVTSCQIKDRIQWNLGELWVFYRRIHVQILLCYLYYLYLGVLYLLVSHCPVLSYALLRNFNTFSELLSGDVPRLMWCEGDRKPEQRRLIAALSHHRWRKNLPLPNKTLNIYLLASLEYPYKANDMCVCTCENVCCL